MLSTIQSRRSNIEGTQAIKLRNTQRMRRVVKDSPVELAIKPLGELIQRLLDYDPKMVKELLHLENPLVRQVLAREMLESRHATRISIDRESMCEILGLVA